MIYALQMAYHELLRRFWGEVEQRSQVYRGADAVGVEDHLSRLNVMDQDRAFLMGTAADQEFLDEHHKMDPSPMPSQGIDGF